MFRMTLSDRFGNHVYIDEDASAQCGGWDCSCDFADWLEDAFERGKKDLGGIESVSVDTDRLGRLDDALGRLDYLWGWDMTINGKEMRW